MSLIDDVKRDRGNGTPGPWGIVYYDAGDKDEWINCPLIEGPEDAVVVHWDGFKQRFWESAHGDQRAIDGNARRIARVPDLEAALLIAHEALRKIANEPVNDTTAEIVRVDRLATDALDILEATE